MGHLTTEPLCHRNWHLVSPQCLCADTCAGVTPVCKETRSRGGRPCGGLCEFPREGAALLALSFWLKTESPPWSPAPCTAPAGSGGTPGRTTAQGGNLLPPLDTHLFEKYMKPGPPPAPAPLTHTSHSFPCVPTGEASEGTAPAGSGAWPPVFPLPSNPGICELGGFWGEKGRDEREATPQGVTWKPPWFRGSPFPSGSRPLAASGSVPLLSPLWPFSSTFASCLQSFISLEHSPALPTAFPSLNPPACVSSPKVTSSSVLVAVGAAEIRKLIWGKTDAALYPFLFDFPSCFSLVISLPDLVCCLRITGAREKEARRVTGLPQRTHVVHGSAGATARCSSC